MGASAPDDSYLWLDPATQDPSHALPLLKPYPAEEMEVYPVSTWVNDPAHDNPEWIQPLSLGPGTPTLPFDNSIACRARSSRRLQSYERG